MLKITSVSSRQKYEFAPTVSSVSENLLSVLFISRFQLQIRMLVKTEPSPTEYVLAIHSTYFNWILEAVNSLSRKITIQATLGSTFSSSRPQTIQHSHFLAKRNSWSLWTTQSPLDALNVTYLASQSTPVMEQCRAVT